MVVMNKLKYYVASFKTTYRFCNKYVNTKHSKVLISLEDNQDILQYLKKDYHCKITKLKYVDITKYIESALEEQKNNMVSY